MTSLEELARTLFLGRGPTTAWPQSAILPRESVKTQNRPTEAKAKQVNFVHGSWNRQLACCRRGRPEVYLPRRPLSSSASKRTKRQYLYLPQSRDVRCPGEPCQYHFHFHTAALVVAWNAAEITHIVEMAGNLVLRGYCEICAGESYKLDELAPESVSLATSTLWRTSRGLGTRQAEMEILKRAGGRSTSSTNLREISRSDLGDQGIARFWLWPIRFVTWFQKASKGTRVSAYATIGLGSLL